MSRFLFAIAFLTSAVAFRAQDAPAPLHGRVEGRTYYSPTGAFSVTIPVLPELGGRIRDTSNVVTFQDDFNVHVSIAAFPQDATQRWELETRGAKDYLVYFFSNFVLPDFRQGFQGVQIESADFLPRRLDGSLITYLLIPGGSMFMNRVPQIGPSDTVPVAKRGNLDFVKNGYIFVVSTELAERVIEGKTYKKTTTEENELLRQRLEDIVAKMQFAKPANSSSSPSTLTPAGAVAPKSTAPTPNTGQ